jgi:hypothetical protein
VIGGDLLLVIALGASTAADGLSTQRALSRCPPPACYERNPITAGKMLWPALAGGTTGAVFASRELRKRGHGRWAQFILVGGTVAHAWAVQNNLRRR